MVQEAHQNYWKVVLVLPAMAGYHAGMEITGNSASASALAFQEVVVAFLKASMDLQRELSDLRVQVIEKEALIKRLRWACGVKVLAGAPECPAWVFDVTAGGGRSKYLVAEEILRENADPNPEPRIP